VLLRSPCRPFCAKFVGLARRTSASKEIEPAGHSGPAARWYPLGEGNHR
jgi:SNF2-related domain